MRLSKRSQYALKAIFELSLRNSEKPLRARDIAKSQGISPRFIEVILNDLKHGGFVESYRGNDGGYVLKRDPSEIMPGEVIKHIEGPFLIGSDHGHGVLKLFWEDVNNAILDAFNQKSLGELVELERALREKESPSYCI
jgi:Rrf2 family protein